MANSFDTEELQKGKGVRSKDAMGVKLVGYLFIGFFALVCVVPFYLIIIASFTSESSLIRNGYPLVLKEFDLQSYVLRILSVSLRHMELQLV